MSVADPSPATAIRGDSIEGRGNGTTAGRRRGDVQGLRGVAILLVVLYHAGLGTPGGFTGVDVFFVISGLVITGTLLRELERSDRIRLRRFYARRVRRLLPAFAVMVVTTAAIGVLASPAVSQRMGAMTAVFASLFSANGYLYHLNAGYFDVSSSLDPYLHTWTLGVEEQFYVFFPALLLVSWLVARRIGANHKQARVVAAFVTAAAAVASGVLAWALARGPGGSLSASWRFSFYSSPTRAWEFAAGALIALLAPWLRLVPKWPAYLVGIAGLGAVIAAGLELSTASRFPTVAAGLPVAGSVAVLAAGTVSEGGLASRLLGLRPLTAIGDLSYSWYLWHWPLIVYATALWPSSLRVATYAAAFSLVPAWISFRYIENPIRTGAKFRRSAVVLAGCCIGAAAVGAFGLLGAAHELRSTVRTLRDWSAQRAPHADVRLGCNSVPLGPKTPAACTWRVARPRGTVVLVGDSQAGQFTEPVTAAAREAHFTAVVSTQDGCPFADVRLTEGAVVEAGCRRFFTGTLDSLIRRRPTLVIVAMRTDLYLDIPSWTLALPNSQGSSQPSARKAAILQAGLRRALAKLSGAGINTIVVHTIPRVPDISGSCAVLLVLSNHCEGSISRAAANRELASAIRLEDSAVSATKHSATLNLEPDLCTTTCRSGHGRTLIYNDPLHLTVIGAEQLTHVFHTVIARPYS